MNIEGFECADCGGLVRLSGGHQVKWTARRGRVYSVPTTVLVPMCESCGVVYLDDDTEERIEAAIQPLLISDEASLVRKLVDSLIGRFDTTIGQIESACGVTPSYLSHLRGGRNLPSETLVRLLEVFDQFPAAFRFSADRYSAPAKSTRIHYERGQLSEWKSDSKSAAPPLVNVDSCLKDIAA